MMTPLPGVTLPDTISAHTTWSAFEYLTEQTDWRIVLIGRAPLKFDVEHDDGFAQALSSGASWKPSDIARAWIANRLVEVVRNELNKTRIRKLSLQVPDDAVSPDFLDGLRWRVCCLVRSQLLRHFDQSIMKWERDAWAHVASLSDPLDRERFRVFVGLDQVVSADAARKAIKYVFHRMHWNLVWEGRYVEFRSDWRFDQIYPRRAALDEAVRARPCSESARCADQ